jgi:hypothetical protein
MKAVRASLIAALVGTLSGAVNAKVSHEEAAKLGLGGAELTPVGAIRAGNARRQHSGLGRRHHATPGRV